MSTQSSVKRPLGLAIFLLLAGTVGLIAAFELTVEKFQLLADPGRVAGCDFGILVQCTANLTSWQGAVFGFPNPLLGLVGFTAVIAMGAAIVASTRLARWMWLLFTAGVVAAMVFVIWLVGQSVFVLGTLCPWCMVTWAVTIPLFWSVILHSLRSGNIPLPASAARVAGALYGWVPLITLVSYLVIAVIAQLRLDVLANI